MARSAASAFVRCTDELTGKIRWHGNAHTGDGHLVTADGSRSRSTARQAVRCAEAVRTDAKTLGIEIRAGIHTGEC